MKSNIEIMKPWQGGVLASIISFILVLFLGDFMNRRMDFIFYLAILFGIMIGIGVAGRMYVWRNTTITVSFTSKKEFMKKLDISLFQMHYKLESDKENFFIYKINNQILYGSHRIAVTLNKNEAIIIGKKPHIKTLQKSFLLE